MTPTKGAQIMKTKHYYIAKTQYYYGPKSRASLERNLNGHCLTLPYKEAKEYIVWMEESTYILGHNESGRPNYRIVGVDSDRGMALINREW